MKQMAVNDHTFIVRIKEKERESWQGTVEWVEDKQKSAFRSPLELLKLLDSTMEPEKA